MAKKASKPKTTSGPSSADVVKPAEPTTAKHTMVGYGTFITRRMFRPDSHPRVVTITGFRRVFNPRIAGFPFVLPDPCGSFKGIAFDVKTDDELREKDRYESCRGDPTVDGEGLYFRMLANIIEADGTTTKAWIYVPTKMTRDRDNVTLDMDTEDKWIDVIKRENVTEFPDLVT
jgi:hypothetical protein